MSTSSHPILLAALDLDGTLLNSNGEVSPCTQKVLSEASDRGVVVIPATGRPLASLPPVVAKQPGCIMPLLPTARRSGISAATRWAVSTAGMPTPQSMRRASRSASSGVLPGGKGPGGLRGVPGPARRAEPLQRRARSPRHGAAALFRRAVRPSGGGEGDRGHPAQRWPLHHLRDQSEWMSRHAHEVEKFCMFFHSAEEAQQYLPRFTAIEGARWCRGRRTTSKSPPPE